MSDRYPNLEKCCDGSNTVENLWRFRRAMREYELFVENMTRRLEPGVMTIEIIEGTLHDPHE